MKQIWAGDDRSAIAEPAESFFLNRSLWNAIIDILKTLDDFKICLYSKQMMLFLTVADVGLVVLFKNTTAAYIQPSF